MLQFPFHIFSTDLPTAATAVSSACHGIKLTIPETRCFLHNQARSYNQFKQARGVTQTTAQRAADLALSCRQSTTWDFCKTATLFHRPNQEFHTNICSLCHGRRNFTQHLGIFSLYGIIELVINYQPMDMPQPFTTSDQHQHTTSIIRKTNNLLNYCNYNNIIHKFCLIYKIFYHLNIVCFI